MLLLFYPFRKKRYANNEREILGIVFGCLKFHHYQYGRKFKCRSDHQPLEKIHLKHLSDASSRLQRLILKIQPHDITIKYIPRPRFPVADALSRVNPSGNAFIKSLGVTIYEMRSQPKMHLKVQEIQQTMRKH